MIDRDSAAQRRYFSGLGRPRRPDVDRSECGRIVKAHRRPVETQEQILATSLAQPHRKTALEPRNPLLGHALGRLYHAKLIDGDQYRAGERYTRLVLRHMQSVTGAPFPNVPPSSGERTARGFDSLEPTPEQDEEIENLRRSWDDAMAALMGTNEFHDCVRLLASVCVMDRDITHSTSIGTFRIALNALHRLWTKGGRA